MVGGASDETYQALLGATLLVPTPDPPSSPGAWELVEAEVLSMLMAEDDEGLLSPAFTDLAALAAWQPAGGTYVERASSWLFGLVAGDPTGRVGIDLGSPGELVVGPAAVAALAQGLTPGSAAAPTQVLVSTPSAPLPPSVAGAVRDAVAAEPAARSARLFQLDVGGERQQVVFVDLAPGITAEDVSSAMGRIVEGIAARTDEAGDLRLMVVTPEWREVYASGGISLDPG